MIFKIGGHKINIGGHKIRVPFKVDNAVIVNDSVVVCYDTTEIPDDSEYAGRNIECLTFEGKRVWLTPRPVVETRQDGTKKKIGYFSVYMTADGKLQSCDFFLLCDLDPATGAVVNMEINR